MFEFNLSLTCGGGSIAVKNTEVSSVNSLKIKGFRGCCSELGGFPEFLLGYCSNKADHCKNVGGDYRTFFALLSVQNCLRTAVAESASGQDY